MASSSSTSGAPPIPREYEANDAIAVSFARDASVASKRIIEYGVVCIGERGQEGLQPTELDGNWHSYILLEDQSYLIVDMNRPKGVPGGTSTPGVFSASKATKVDLKDFLAQAVYAKSVPIEVVFTVKNFFEFLIDTYEKLLHYTFLPSTGTHACYWYFYVVYRLILRKKLDGRMARRIREDMEKEDLGVLFNSLGTDLLKPGSPPVRLAKDSILRHGNFGSFA